MNTSYFGERVKKYRKNLKEKIVFVMGGRCQVCGYCKCNSALELHHINKEEKDYNISRFMSNPKKWEVLKEELKKCVLLCSNCHRELHQNIINIENIQSSYNENLLEEFENQLKIKKDEEEDKIFNKINWSSIDLEKELKTKSIREISDILGCSKAAIIKRIKKLKIEFFYKKTPPSITKEELVILLEKMPATQIAKNFRIRIETLKKLVSNYGLSLKPASFWIKNKKWASVSSNSIRPHKRKVQRPSKDELISLIQSKPLTQIGVQFGVSDNAVRKWAKYYEINIKEISPYSHKVRN